MSLAALTHAASQPTWEESAARVREFLLDSANLRLKRPGGEGMLAKKILAGIFAVLILVKLAALLINPGQDGCHLGKVFLEHHFMVTGIYLVLLAITGYFIFSSLNLIDMALVMFFTSLLTGLTLMPYSTQMLQLGEAMAAAGIRQGLAGPGDLGGRGRGRAFQGVIQESEITLRSWKATMHDRRSPQNTASSAIWPPRRAWTTAP